MARNLAEHESQKHGGPVVRIKVPINGVLSKSCCYLEDQQVLMTMRDSQHNILSFNVHFNMISFLVFLAFSISSILSEKCTLKVDE